ncbi:MAG: 1-acyl-sn-glycerol-3-phosphate acyltransferase [Maricaulaceae bacterium]
MRDRATNGFVAPMEARTPAPLSGAPAAPAEPSDQHIVDALIEERAEKLMSRPRLWPLVKAVFYPLLGYQKARRVADTIAPLSGEAAMDWSVDFLDMTVEATDVEQVPAEGPAVIVANHPGGIADGIAVWTALKARRPDMVFFANRDALRVCPGLDAVVIPVEWRPELRSREKTRDTLRMSIEAFKAGRCVVVFPAGRMSEWSWAKRRLVEREWLPTASSLARKFDAPIVPLGVRQRLSLYYYALAQVSEELKNMTVFHELLAKKKARYRLGFGAPVHSSDLPTDDAAATLALRDMCERLAWG